MQNVQIVPILIVIAEEYSPKRMMFFVVKLQTDHIKGNEHRDHLSQLQINVYSG